MFNIPDTTPEAVHIAKALLTLANNESDHRVEFHRACFDTIWRNSAASPGDILAALGTNAAKYFQAASESVRHISEIAAISGLTIEEVLPATDREMPVDLVFHEDGTATLAYAGVIDTPS
jgi:hypothetical protein